MKTGIELISAERERQISKEKFTANHDDAHDARELANASRAYLKHYCHRAWVWTNELGMPGIVDGVASYREEKPPGEWPWNDEDWKPKSPIDDLIKAGALIAAELDRLQRLPSKK